MYILMLQAFVVFLLLNIFDMYVPAHKLMSRKIHLSSMSQRIPCAGPAQSIKSRWCTCCPSSFSTSHGPRADENHHIQVSMRMGKTCQLLKKTKQQKKNNREKCLERLSSGPIPSGPYSTHEPEERWEDCKALSLPPGESSPVIGISVKGVPSPCCHMSPSRAVPSCHLSLRQPGRSGPSACACPMQSLGASCRAPHLAWRCTGSCQPQHIAAQMGRKQEQQT